MFTLVLRDRRDLPGRKINRRPSFPMEEEAVYLQPAWAAAPWQIAFGDNDIRSLASRGQCALRDEVPVARDEDRPVARFLHRGPSLYGQRAEFHTASGVRPLDQRYRLQVTSGKLKQILSLMQLENSGLRLRP